MPKRLAAGSGNNAKNNNKNRIRSRRKNFILFCRRVRGKIAFENYVKSQLTFVQNVAELAAKPAYAISLYESRAVEAIMPLGDHSNATIRTNAVLALARLAGNSEPSVKQVVLSRDALNRLFDQIAKENVRLIFFFNFERPRLFKKIIFFNCYKTGRRPYSNETYLSRFALCCIV